MLKKALFIMLILVMISVAYSSSAERYGIFGAFDLAAVKIPDDEIIINPPDRKVTPPLPPANFRITSLQGRVTVEWDEVPGANGYYVYSMTEDGVSARNFYTDDDYGPGAFIINDKDASSILYNFYWVYSFIIEKDDNGAIIDYIYSEASGPVYGKAMEYFPTDHPDGLYTDIPGAVIIPVDFNQAGNKAYKETVESLWQQFDYMDFDIVKARIDDHDADNDLYKNYYGFEKSGRYLLVNCYSGFIDVLHVIRERHLDFYDAATGKLYGSVYPNRYTLYYLHDDNTLIIGLFWYSDVLSLETLLPGKLSDYYYYLLKY